jgi:hypothetical protein
MTIEDQVRAIAKAEADAAVAAHVAAMHGTEPEPPDPPDPPEPIPSSKAASGVVWTDAMPGTPVYSQPIMNTFGSSCAAHNRHIMGWGTLNPWPTSTQGPQLAAFNQQVATMVNTPGVTIPMITFAICPDWMKGGPDGSTNWGSPPRDQSWFETPPNPQYEAQYAQLCAAVAQANPKVKMFAIWNEMKGMWRNDPSRWDYDRYIRLYNLIRAAVLKVRPDAQLGGPYPFCHFAGVSYAGDEVSGSQVYGAFGKMDRHSQKVFTEFKARCEFEWWAFDSNLNTTWGTAVSPEAACGRIAGVTGWLMSLSRKPVFCMETYPGTAERYLSILDQQTAAAGGTACGSLLWGESSEAVRLLWSGTNPTPLANVLAARRPPR